MSSLRCRIGGEPIKYEMDKAAGALFVDPFFLYTPTRYARNAGFIPHRALRGRRSLRRARREYPPDHRGHGYQRAAHWRVKNEDEAGGDEKIVAVPSDKLTKRHRLKSGGDAARQDVFFQFGLAAMDFPDLESDMPAGFEHRDKARGKRRSSFLSRPQVSRHGQFHDFGSMPRNQQRSQMSSAY